MARFDTPKFFVEELHTEGDKTFGRNERRFGSLASAFRFAANNPHDRLHLTASTPAGRTFVAGRKGGAWTTKSGAPLLTVNNRPVAEFVR